MNANTDLNLDSHRSVPGRRAVTVLSRPAALAAGAALVLAAAGCESAAKSTASDVSKAASKSPPTPTKAEYVAEANAICSAANGPLDATALKLATESNPAEAVHVILGSFIPQIKSQLTQIQAIGTPAGGQATIARMDRLLSGDISRIEKDPALAGPTAFHDFAKVAHGYGLTACAPLS